MILFTLFVTSKILNIQSADFSLSLKSSREFVFSHQMVLLFKKQTCDNTHCPWAPSERPTENPSQQPTDTPSEVPSASPSQQPSDIRRLCDPISKLFCSTRVDPAALLPAVSATGRPTSPSRLWRRNASRSSLMSSGMTGASLNAGTMTAKSEFIIRVSSYVQIKYPIALCTWPLFSERS